MSAQEVPDALVGDDSLQEDSLFAQENALKDNLNDSLDDGGFATTSIPLLAAAAELDSPTQQGNDNLSIPTSGTPTREEPPESQGNLLVEGDTVISPSQRTVTERKEVPLQNAATSINPEEPKKIAPVFSKRKAAFQPPTLGGRGNKTVKEATEKAVLKPSFKAPKLTAQPTKEKSDLSSGEVENSNMKTTKSADPLEFPRNTDKIATNTKPIEKSRNKTNKDEQKENKTTKKEEKELKKQERELKKKEKQETLEKKKLEREQKQQERELKKKEREQKKQERELKKQERQQKKQPQQMQEANKEKEQYSLASEVNTKSEEQHEGGTCNEEEEDLVADPKTAGASDSDTTLEPCDVVEDNIPQKGGDGTRSSTLVQEADSRVDSIQGDQAGEVISEAKSPSSDASHENGNAPFSSQTSCDEPTECSEGSERNNSKDTVRDCNVRQQGKPGHFKASLTVSKGSKTSEEQTVTKVKSKPANSINKLKDKNTKEVKKRRGSEGDKKIPARKKPKVVSPVWVQCDSCDKWRLLRDCMDPSALPKKWTCSMNSDPSANSCTLEECEWEDPTSSQEFVYAKFTEGSLVWAKQLGYPWWPGIIENDPDYDVCMSWEEDDPPEDAVPIEYHVVYFGKPVSRAWIQSSSVEAFTEGSNPPEPMEKSGKVYVRALKAAVKEATEALKEPPEMRLNKYNFSKRFKKVKSRKRAHSNDSDGEGKTLSNKKSNLDSEETTSLRVNRPRRIIKTSKLIEEVETDVAKENDNVSLKESDSALPLSSSGSLSDD